MGLRTRSVHARGIDAWNGMLESLCVKDIPKEDSPVKEIRTRPQRDFHRGSSMMWTVRTKTW